jgi:hypothetical protein
MASATDTLWFIVARPYMSDCTIPFVYRVPADEPDALACVRKAIASCVHARLEIVYAVQVDKDTFVLGNMEKVGYWCPFPSFAEYNERQAWGHVHRDVSSVAIYLLDIERIRDGGEIVYYRDSRAQSRTVVTEEVLQDKATKVRLKILNDLREYAADAVLLQQPTFSADELADKIVAEGLAYERASRKRRAESPIKGVRRRKK